MKGALNKSLTKRRGRRPKWQGEFGPEEHAELKLEPTRVARRAALSHTPDDPLGRSFFYA